MSFLHPKVFQLWDFVVQVVKFGSGLEKRITEAKGKSEKEWMLAEIPETAVTCNIFHLLSIVFRLYYLLFLFELKKRQNTQYYHSYNKVENVYRHIYTYS